MAKKQTELSWYARVAEIMAKRDCNIQQACFEEDLPVTTLEADEHFKSPAFQTLLRRARAKHYAEVADDPASHSKRIVVGKLIKAAELLTSNGSHDKAAEVLHKVCKIEGWDKSDNQMNLFGGVTAKDLEEMKAKLEKTNEPASPDLRTVN